jgi:MFS family permease
MPISNHEQEVPQMDDESEPRAEGGMSAQRKMLIIAACYGMMAVSFLPAANANFLQGIMTDFGLNNAAGGLILSMVFWGGLCTSLFFGPVADRFKLRLILLTGVGIQLLGLMFLAGAQSNWQLYLGPLCGGLGNSMTAIMFVPLISRLLPGSRLQAYYFITALPSVGAVVGILSVWLLFALGGRWPSGYLMVIFMLCPLLPAFVLLKIPAKASDTHAPPIRLGELLRMVRSKEFLLLGAAMFLAAGTEVGISMWAPSYVKQTTSAGAEIGSVLFLLYTIAGTLGKLSASFLSRRLKEKYLVFTGAGLAAVGLVLAAASNWAVLTIIGTTCCGLGVAAFGGSLLARATLEFPHAGTSLFPALNVFGTLGATSISSFVGAVGDWNIHAAMGLVALAPLGVAIIRYMILPRVSAIPT